MYRNCFSSAGRGNGRGAMPFVMSFALEHGIVTLTWIDNVSVQFPLNIYATKGLTHTWMEAGERRDLAAPLLGPLPTPASWGEEANARAKACCPLYCSKDGRRCVAATHGKH